MKSLMDWGRLCIFAAPILCRRR